MILSLAITADEEEVDSWLNELKSRVIHFNEPFYYISSNRIIPLKSWKEIPEYFLCIYYSFYGAGDHTNGTKLFENISANALKNFLNGEVYALGFPAGKGLNAYLAELAEFCCEKINLPAHHDYKDDRVDVIGYKLFNDGRPANMYVLLQCAAGQNWRNKQKIELNRWTNYIIWYRETIILSISTVDYVERDEWDKYASDYGMLIDRLRIYNTLYDREIKADLREDVIDWCNQVIPVEE